MVNYMWYWMPYPRYTVFRLQKFYKYNFESIPPPVPRKGCSCRGVQESRLDVVGGSKR